MSKIIEKILEVLQFQAEVAVDFLDTALAGKLGSSYERDRLIRFGPRSFRTNWADSYRRRQRFYGMLNYLVREGLVEKRRGKRNSVWKITARGLRKLARLKKQRREDLLSLLNADFSKPVGSGFTVVVFDIPEREYKKRTWLRVSLVNMGFRFLQKSVWLSKGKVPEEFIHALRERAMLDYVHIFSVSSRGTIREEEE